MPNTRAAESEHSEELADRGHDVREQGGALEVVDVRHKVR